MYRALYEEMKDVEDREAWFEERTAKHIALVQAAANKIVKAYPELAELQKQAGEHDASKLVEPERKPYIDLTWKHKFDDYKSYKTPGDIDDEAINKATLHHITTNRHHPEYGTKAEKSGEGNREVVDASKMTDIDMAEMVADWQAMSEELGKNTAREWYMKQHDVRWHFTDRQESFIDKLLKVFETREPYHSMDPHDGIGEDDGW